VGSWRAGRPRGARDETSQMICLRPARAS
jgi:hypothetical protein